MGSFATSVLAGDDAVVFLGLLGPSALPERGHVGRAGEGGSCGGPGCSRMGGASRKSGEMLLSLVMDRSRAVRNECGASSVFDFDMSVFD